jgi:hypothetical protein
MPTRGIEPTKRCIAPTKEVSERAACAAAGEDRKRKIASAAPPA